MTRLSYPAPPQPTEAQRPPQHLAIIMDGNGRWAEAQGLPRSEGHKAGSEKVNRVVRWCRQWGLRYLTLYAFSDQNWGRPEPEVGALMSLLLRYIQEQRPEIMEHKIRLMMIGDEARLPLFVRAPLKALIRETAHHDGMTLTLALSYGGREELTRCVQRVAAKVASGELALSELSEQSVAEHLDAPSLPDPDLILRTSGEQRLSNFLLWQCAYAELEFLNKPWPEVSAEDLLSCFERFNNKERRFGLTGAQLTQLT